MIANIIDFVNDSKEFLLFAKKATICLFYFIYKISDKSQFRDIYTNMNKFWVLILVSFFATNSMDKAVESVKLDENPYKIFDEIFGEGWWDKGKDEEWHNLALEQTFHHQIDRQNTQIEPNSTDQNAPLTESDHPGQIGPKSTDQNAPLTESDHPGQIGPKSTDQNPPLTESDHPGQIGPNSTDQNAPLTESDHPGQIGPKSTDQNPPLTESDHSDNAKNGEKQNEMSSNENIAEDERKRKIVDKFHAIKDKFKQKRKYSAKEWALIDQKIAKHLKVSRIKIYEWKKEFGLSQKVIYEKEERKHLVEKFDQKKAELKRDGFKYSYDHEIAKTVAQELGLSFRTIYAWKRKLGQTKPKHKHSHIEQKELMKLYYGIKDKNPKIRDEDIVKSLKIGTDTLIRWKRQFKRQQLDQNSVDGHSVEENASSNRQAKP